jgi:GT2 family glycosyltransferase
MRVFVLIPVFNRLTQTQRVVEALKQQTLVKHLIIIIINDGSTDGTHEYLTRESGIIGLAGDGNLWWAGAIQKGLEYVRNQQPSKTDYVLFLNNDVWFDKAYIETLIAVSQAHEDAAVGSVIYDTSKNPQLTSLGPRVNINRVAVWDVLSELSDTERRHPKSIYSVDALSGRGTLYPVFLFQRFGEMRPRLLPHYYADYEVAMRFRRGGVRLLVPPTAVVYSESEFGNDISSLGWWTRHFSRRSSSNLIHKTVFYLLVGSPIQRMTAPLRLFFFFVKGVVRTWRQ